MTGFNEILKDEDYRRVLKVIESLDKTTQKIIKMRADKDTFIEIGVTLNLNPKTVESRFYRARKKIKKAVSENTARSLKS